MSRLYLIFLLAFPIQIWSQQPLNQLLRYGQELYDKGDFYHAKLYYEQAMQIDSQTLSIQWNYAEVLRLYQDYAGAARMYAKVYKKDGDYQNPNCGLYLAMMLQQQGKYQEAIEILERVSKSLGKDKKSEKRLWVDQITKSCQWAINQKDSSDFDLLNIPEPINSKHAEFPHAVRNNELIFSSLRTDSIERSEEVYAKDYRSGLYSMKIDEMKKVEVLEDIKNPAFHQGNGCFSLDSSRFYFSICTDSKLPYQCKIFVANHSNGRFFGIDSLGSVINEAGSSNTQPAIAQINGEEVLIFASDRNGGEGGMDLYYSIIKKGNQYSKPKNLKGINTIGNEITPFFDNEKKQLYFSSNFHIGFGGYDILFSTVDANFNFSNPKNLGKPFNSPENDNYLITYGQSYFLASNRKGSLYAKNPTCCADIYLVKPREEQIEIAPPVEVVLNPDLPILELPVLFFHNDSPNPRSRANTTELTYLETYETYFAMKSEYESEWAKGKPNPNEASIQIDSLFQFSIQKGLQDLEKFENWLLSKLESGAQLELVIRGFASPLTSSDYNVSLTRRRIESLVNHLETTKGGVFLPYLNGTATNGARLLFEKIPFGEYASNQKISDDRSDVQNSVYAPQAALARRIEVKAVRFLDQNDPDAAVRVSNSQLDLGKIDADSTKTFSFSLVNRSNNELQISKVEIPCSCVQINESSSKIAALSDIEISGSYTALFGSGPQLIPIKIYFSNGSETTVFIGVDIYRLEK